MGHASGLLDPSYFRLRDYLGLEPIPPYRSGHTSNYYDERILERLGTDFRRVILKEKKWVDDSHDQGFVDNWGVRQQKMGMFVHSSRNPLSEATTVAEVEQFAWPRAEDMFSAEGVAAEARRLYEETDYAVVARNPLGEGFLDRSCSLMGMAEFMVALSRYPQVAECIVAHLVGIYKDVWTMFLDEVGPFVQMVEVGDDLAANQNPLISPKMYRQFIKPAEMALYTLIHEKAPHAALFMHTDGAVFDLIPDLIEAGVNVLNPTQTSCAGMDARRLKETYGQQITFHGAIQNIEEDVLVDDLVAEVKERIDVLGPGGGYILAPCNYFVNVRPEIVITMYEVAREYGQYR
jgi:uroporphyrinogen decarboxylase